MPFSNKKRLAVHSLLTAMAPTAKGSSDAGSMHKYVDKVKVTTTQLKHWRMLLAVAFIMTGWSFATVENPHFVDFMQHVRPNFETLAQARVTVI